MRPAQIVPDSTQRVPIESGAERTVWTPDGQAATVQVCSASQRLWSRIGRGTLGGKPVFLKQICDVRGRWSPQQYRYECKGLEVAASTLGGVADVPCPLALEPDQLLLVMEDRRLESMDELLRRSPETFERAIVPSLGQIAGLLDRLATVDPAAELHTKLRHYGSEPNSLFFKGLEVRNVGYPRDTQNFAQTDLTVFDLGRPFLTSREDAAGRMFLSIGMLNWGRPLRRFLQGPDEGLLLQARRVLGSRLDPTTVDALLEKERQQRLEEFRSGGALGGLVKSVLIPRVGARYFDRLKRWCAAEL